MSVELKGVVDDSGSQQQQLTMLVKTHGHDERIDGFWEHYRPYELTVLGDQYSSNMPNSVRCHAFVTTIISQTVMYSRHWSEFCHVTFS